MININYLEFQVHVSLPEHSATENISHWRAQVKNSLCVCFVAKERVRVRFAIFHNNISRWRVSDGY